MKLTNFLLGISIIQMWSCDADENIIIHRIIQKAVMASMVVFVCKIIELCSIVRIFNTHVHVSTFTYILTVRTRTVHVDAPYCTYLPTPHATKDKAISSASRESRVAR